jgi:hypothetical protein
MDMQSNVSEVKLAPASIFFGLYSSETSIYVQRGTWRCIPEGSPLENHLQWKHIFLELFANSQLYLQIVGQCKGNM